MRGLAALLVVLPCAVAAADAPPRDTAELRAAVAKILEREGVPGAGLALVAGDAVWAGGVGLADRASARPVTADTLFRVGSITKSVVALTVVRLAERGLIDLDAPVARLAPELAIENRWAAEAPITVAHLLEHTAGFDDMHPNESDGPRSVERMPLGEVLARNPASRVARWRPGSRFSYANPGYTVAAYLIEKVTGLPYETVVAREVLAPLGMRGAALRLTPEVEARLARGYHRGPDALPYWSFYHRPAGNLMASPRELAALVRLGLGRGAVGGTRLVSRESWGRIERAATVQLASGDASYGLGNYGDVLGGATARGHAGGLPGFHSLYGYLPDCDAGFVVLLNSTGSPRALAQIRDLVIAYLTRDRPPPPPPEVRVPEEQLARWSGNYHFASPRHQLLAFLARLQPGIEVRVVDGALQLAVREVRIPLIPTGDDRFRIRRASGSHLAFGHDLDGRRIFVDHGAYFVEEPRWQSWLFEHLPPVCVWILASAWLLPLAAVFRRDPAAGYRWPLATSLSFFAAARCFLSFPPAGVNLTTLGLFLGTLCFAFGALVCVVQAVAWLKTRRGSLVTRVHRVVFAAAAGATAVYLWSYGLIGIRWWSY